MFYANALDDPSVVSALAEFNITQEDLEQSQALVAQVETLKEVQERAKTTAQIATQTRTDALKGMDDWSANFGKWLASPWPTTGNTWKAYS